jgi:hypothetical protein
VGVGAAVDVVDQVPPQDGSRLESQRVNASTRDRRRAIASETTSGPGRS